MTTPDAATAFTLPDHVPSERFWDDDITRFASQFEDPFIGIGALHALPDLIYARGAARGAPGWVPTRFAILDRIFMDPANFSSADNIGVGPLIGVDWRLNPLEYDPPQHMAYRQTLQPFFQPKKVEGYDAMIRGIARELIAKVEDGKGCEFIDAFASLFPSYVFLDLFGLPREELPQFFEWEHMFTRSRDLAVRAQGARSILHYLEAYVDKRRATPADDLVTGIINGEIKGRPLDHGEVMGMVMVLYFGGLDTVLSSLGWYFRHLAMDPALQQRLRDHPDDIAGATDDLLRAYGVVGTRRTVVNDIEIDGVLLKKGDIVLMPGYLACRDERQYTNPHVVDPGRKARHLTLATGVHNCLGAHLAKREIRIVLEEWLSRFRNIRIVEGSEQAWDATGVWAMTKLELAWD